MLVLSGGCEWQDSRLVAIYVGRGQPRIGPSNMALHLSVGRGRPPAGERQIVRRTAFHQVTEPKSHGKESLMQEKEMRERVQHVLQAHRLRALAAVLGIGIGVGACATSGSSAVRNPSSDISNPDAGPQEDSPLGQIVPDYSAPVPDDFWSRSR